MRPTPTAKGAPPMPISGAGPQPKTKKGMCDMKDVAVAVNDAACPWFRPAEGKCGC